MFDVSKLCSRATRSLLLLSVLLGLSSCGGCFGGQGDGSGLLRDAVLGEDVPERQYKAPIIHIASSPQISQRGEIVGFGVVQRREAPLIRWEVNIEMMCGEERCEEHDAFYEGEFADEDRGTIELEHVVPAEVTSVVGDVVIFFVGTNTDRPIRSASRRLSFARHEPSEYEWLAIIETQEDLERLPISEDGVFDGDLHIIGVHDLKDLSALSKLREIRGELLIHSNPDLVSMRGLEQLERVDRSVSIWDNWALEDPLVLPSLREATSLTFGGINGYGQETLEPAPALANVEELEFIGIIGNKTYGGFEALEFVEKVIISHSSSLEKVTIEGSDDLIHINVLSLRENYDNTSIALGPQVRSLSTLEVVNNFNTPPLSGLSNVGRAQNIIIKGNHGLESMEGLSRLHEVHVLEVVDNKDLVSLEGLDNLDKVNASFKFMGNEKLPDCEVAALELRTRGDDASYWAQGLDCP